MRKAHLSAFLLHGAAAIAVGAVAPGAAAQSAGTFSFQLPEQTLGASLRAVAAQSRSNILASSDLVDARPAPALVGNFTAGEAVARLLKGSGLHSVRVGPTLVVKPDRESARDSAEGDQADVVVTGSRIRGAPIASTVLRTTQQDIRDSGRTDLGQVIREIPQNFGGGQNPGIGQGVPNANGADIGGGSALDLRGLGSDATLTLLNGHRLAYTAVFQSVDISAIPVAILDRIEIVPDGASAIYGSDAIAGVANVILKRDFDGAELSASLGTATDGGDFEQRYGVMAGRTWTSGGLVGAFEYGRNSQVRSDQRSYADDQPGLTLFPPMRHESAVVTGHQAIGSALTLSFDALYNHRTSLNDFPLVPPGDPSDSHGTFSSIDRSLAIAPTLEWSGTRWRAQLSATYGQEKVDYAQTECDFGTCGPTGSGFYRNREYSAELGTDGVLATLPGGAAKLAFGGGYRGVEFERYNGADAVNLNTQHRQNSYFAYGELSVPLVGPDNATAFLYRASLSAAARYENYPGIGHIVRPKFGIVAGPTPDFDVKLSWGKSFRAPTQYEQYQPRSVYLFPPSFVGGMASSPAATTLIALGGNRNLKPERATTLSATFDLHPRDSRFDLAATFYSVAYRDRIVAPIQYLGSALSDPAYAAQVIRNPTASQVAATIASGATFLNYSGAAFDPANVVAIVDGSNVNAGRVSARGVDVTASYALPVGRDMIALAANVGYLDSMRRVSADSPLEILAGTIFNPPHWRGRGTASWRAGDVTLTGDLNVIGGVRDVRAAQKVWIGGMTTAGLTARWVAGPRSRWLEGFDFSVSAQNLLDAKPHTILRTTTGDTPYDSTNYSAIGRFLSVAVRKSW